MWKIKFLSAENLKLVYFLEIVTFNLRRKVVRSIFGANH